MGGKRLDRVLASRKENERLVYKIAELQAIAEKSTSSLTQTPKGGGGLKDDVYAQLMDYKNMLDFKALWYEYDQEQLELELDCIADPDVRTAMKYYYIDGLTQANIAEIMGICDKSVRRYLSKGRTVYDRVYAD